MSTLCPAPTDADHLRSGKRVVTARFIVDRLGTVVFPNDGMNDPTRSMLPFVTSAAGGFRSRNLPSAVRL
jgi:hypothetical protein